VALTVGRANPKTNRVLGLVLEKAVKSPLFLYKFRVAFPKLQFWESLGIQEVHHADNQCGAFGAAGAGYRRGLYADQQAG
jgi:hypothetical protein